MRLGIAHHYGWAIAVSATDDHDVVDRRRIELLDRDLPSAPIHHEGGTHAMHHTGQLRSDEALADLVAEVRASVVRATRAALRDLVDTVSEPYKVIAVRDWPDTFPTDIATLRRPPYESRADSVMYCQVLAAVGAERGWDVYRYDAKTVESQAASQLGARAHAVLHGPRAPLGSPWSNDHRIALAATILSVSGSA